MIIEAIVIFLICVGIVLTIGFLADWYTALYTGIGLMLTYICGLVAVIYYEMKQRESYILANNGSVALSQQPNVDTLNTESNTLQISKLTQKLIQIMKKNEEANSASQVPLSDVKFPTSDRLISKISNELSDELKLDTPDMPEINNNINYDNDIIVEILPKLNLVSIENQKTIINNSDYAALIAQMTNILNSTKYSKLLYNNYLSNESNSRRVIHKILKQINNSIYKNRSKFGFKGTATSFFIVPPAQDMSNYNITGFTRNEYNKLFKKLSEISRILYSTVDIELDDDKYIQDMIYAVFSYIRDESNKVNTDEALDAMTRDVLIYSVITVLKDTIIDYRKKLDKFKRRLEIQIIKPDEITNKIIIKMNELIDDDIYKIPIQ